MTSVAGVVTFTILSVHLHGPGGSGLVHRDRPGHRLPAGGYTGARIQSHLPDALIRRVMGVLVIAIGTRYLWSGLR